MDVPRDAARRNGTLRVYVVTICQAEWRLSLAAPQHVTNMLSVRPESHRYDPEVTPEEIACKMSEISKMMRANTLHNLQGDESEHPARAKIAGKASAGRGGLK